MKETKLLFFVTQDVYMCIELCNVIKLLPLVELKTVPESPCYHVGLMNLHGLSIPIIDLAILIGLQRSKEYSLDLPILLFGYNTKKIGFVIDQIIGLAELSEINLQNKITYQNDTIFEGSIIHNQASSLMINPAKLLQKVSL